MPRPLLLAAAAAVLLLHATLAWLDGHPTPRQPVGDELRYLGKAEQLLHDEPVEVDLLWPPLYSRFLATGLALGGRAAVILVQTLLLAGVAAIFRSLTRRLVAPEPGDSNLAPDLVALLVLGYPPLAAYAHYFWPEILHLFLFALVLWILASRLERPPASAPGHESEPAPAMAAPWLLLLGLALGLALLAKSLLQGFLPVLLLALVWRQPPRRALARLALVALAAGVTVAPAVIENLRQTGVPVIADSSRFNLWLGLTDQGTRDRTDREVGEAYREYLASAATYPQRDQILAGRIRAHVAERGWPAVLGAQLGKQYFRLFDRDSALTDQLPGGLLAERGRGYRQAPGGLAAALRVASYAVYALLLAAAPLGVALFPPRGRAWVWVLHAFFAYHLLLFFALHATSRYAVPLLPLLALWAGLALARLAGTGVRGLAAAVARPRLAVAGLAMAGLGAIVLEWLAFGGAR